MRWLYPLQRRIALAPTEAGALLVIAALFVGGSLVHHFRQPEPPDFAALYAQLDSTVAEETARLNADTATLAALPLAAAPSTAAPAERPPPPPDTALRIDLNTATAAELQRLPGIGPALAGRILAYRDAHGPFADVAHLTRVRGIGPKTLAKLRPLVYIAD